MTEDDFKKRCDDIAASVGSSSYMAPDYAADFMLINLTFDGNYCLIASDTTGKELDRGGSVSLSECGWRWTGDVGHNNLVINMFVKPNS